MYTKYLFFHFHLLAASMLHEKLTIAEILLCRLGHCAFQPPAVPLVRYGKGLKVLR